MGKVELWRCAVLFDLLRSSVGYVITTLEAGTTAAIPAGTTNSVVLGTHPFLYVNPSILFAYWRRMAPIVLLGIGTIP